MSSAEDHKTPAEETETSDPVADETPAAEAAPEALVDGDPDANKLREERDYYLDQVQRARAELDNYRRRVAREREQQSRRITIDLFRSVLPLLDDLQLALRAEPDSADPAQLRTGLELISDKFLQVLQDHRIEAVEAVGQPFDPMVHEAMFQEETDDAPDGQVLEEFERGYQLGEDLIRPARVKVAKGKS